MKFLFQISIIFCLSFSSDLYEYEIKSFGIKVAKCDIAISDTIYNNESSILLEYSVSTLNIFNRLFPINNKYTIIINSNNSTTYFKKYTTQPQITNSIETKIIDGKVYYSDSNYYIPPNTLNIFSLLYLLMKNPDKINSDNNAILEREGKMYSYSIINKDKEYILNLFAMDDDEGLIKYTDIFTWAIFKDDVKRHIYINDNRIDKCVVKNGLLNFSAEYIDR